MENLVGINQIYNEDCLETMKRMPDNFIDLTVTSPPYDNLRDYKGYSFMFENIAQELFRITKQGGVVVWVVGDSTVNGSETGTSFRQALFFMDCGFRLHDTMIYEKNGSSMPGVNRYLQSFEYMFVFSKGKPKTFNPLKDRKNRFTQRWGGGKVVRKKDGSLKPVKKFKSNKYGMRFNIWRYNTGYGYGTPDVIAFQHPATFPELLAADHIKSWSNEKDLIYDPMAGSGTVGKMSHVLNRNYIMSECSSEYCKIIQKRLKPYLENKTFF